MAMFHLDTAFMLEVIAFSAGLALLHFGKVGSAVLLRTAGWVLLAASLASAACTVYYGIRYHVQGEFDHAYGMPSGCPERGGHGHMRGTRGGMGGMHGMMMGPPQAQQAAPEAAATPAAEGAPAPEADEEPEAGKP
jgi:hypothetical protein